MDEGVQEKERVKMIVVTKTVGYKRTKEWIRDVTGVRGCQSSVGYTYRVMMMN